MKTPLDYEHIIESKIDVSRPYYALKNEPTNEVHGIICDVIPEMTQGREGGTHTLAEAGRHMAIAGSIAAAMVLWYNHSRGSSITDIILCQCQ